MRGLSLVVFLGVGAILRPALAQTPAPARRVAGETSTISTAAGTAIARQVAEELKAEDLTALASRFDETMAKALPEANLRIFWAQTLERAGALRACGEPQLRVAGEFTVALSECTFEKQKAELRLTIRPDGRLAGMFLVPESAGRPDWEAPGYVSPGAFAERETTVKSGAVTLPATLTMPKGEGPFPGVILVHGSGPHDRDETVGGTRVFQDLAQGLASRGIAVLRYEKRTKAYEKDLAGIRVVTLKDEVLDDAVTALGLLRAQPRVDPARVFVLGHSLGAMLAPRIAVLDGKTAGVVLLAAPSRPMSDVVADQVAALSGPHATAAQISSAPALRRESQALTDLYAGKKPEAATILGAPPAYWLELKRESPTSVAAGLGLPILVLQGGRDYQVTAKDFAGWTRALRGIPNATLRSYPKLNHLFVAGEGPSTPADYEKPGHVAGEVVEDIASFVLTGTPRRAEGKPK